MTKQAASQFRSTCRLHQEESVMAGRDNVRVDAPRGVDSKEEVVDDGVLSESESQSELESDSKDERRLEHRQMKEEQLGEGGIEVREGAMETLEVGDSAGSHLISHREGSQENCRFHEESKARGRMTHQELLASVTAQAILQTQANNQLQTPVYLTSAEQSQISVNQSVSSASCSTVYDQNLSSGRNSRSLCSAGVDMQGSNENSVFTPVALKTSVSDGYNWRKYGQKQVKSPKGSRSYFRCTYSGCSAKKIECCDHVGHVVETVSRSHHNHDPPRKVNSLRESRIVRSVRPSVEHNASEQSVKDLSITQTSTSSKKLARETPIVPHSIQRISNGKNGDGETTTSKEDVNNKEAKRSGKKNSLSGPDPLLRPGKKRKFVVHAAGDVGISADGYRWRKYGQKMVKGNSHPRNYYRCTSYGCPVRKHTEIAADNTSTAIITYKGIHDHDMPIPKKRHGPPSAPLVAAASPAAMNRCSSQTKTLDSNSTTTWSLDTDGEPMCEAMDLGDEKAMESARTLLSIGFEIKPC